MAMRNISLEDLTTAIKNGTSYTGAGQFDGPHRTYLLQPQGQLSTAEQYEQLIVGQNGGAPVFLKDVATAKQTVQDERIDMRFWARGYPTPGATVVVAVFRRAGANAVEVTKSVRDLLPSIQSQLPTSVRIVSAYDRSQTIVTGIKDVQATLYIAFVLVVMVIFIFLGRATDTLIPAVALPLSLLLTFVAMNVLGYSLDNLSLMALTLAIGFLVDDAIVFLENTERIIGGVENRVLGVYGRYLWFFLRYRWISAVIWFVCLLGTGYLFYSVPKSFLPVGDSSFIRGVLVAQEGSSPEQMHAYQDAAEKVMHGNPAVASTFTMSGNGQFLPSNQAFLLAFLKDPAERAPIDQVAGQLMGGIMSTVPGALAFLQPNPVLEISTGRSEEHTSELQSRLHLVCRLLLEKKKNN